MKEIKPIDDGAIKAKLGWDVFKPGGEPHIKIRPGKEGDARLRGMIRLCPAGLYRESPTGPVELSTDGCLECGTCRIICGTDVLQWEYPEGGGGVQYRCG